MALYPGEYGGKGPIVLDNVECNGTESRLADCKHGEWGQSSCLPYNTAGVMCMIGKITN